MDGHRLAPEREFQPQISSMAQMNALDATSGSSSGPKLWKPAVAGPICAIEEICGRIPQEEVDWNSVFNANAGKRSEQRSISPRAPCAYNSLPAAADLRRALSY